MRNKRLVFTLFPALLLSGVFSAAAQQLTCPSSAGVGATDCSIVHYHVQIWRPSSNRAYELYGLNQFSSVEACERARGQEESENLQLISTLRRLNPKSKMQPNRYGPCHCDMTESSTNPYFLESEARKRQFRLFEEVRREVRAELMREGLSNDAVEIRSLATKPSSFPSSHWPKFVPPPPAGDENLIEPKSVVLKDTAASQTKAVRATISPEIQLAQVEISGEGIELSSGTGPGIPVPSPYAAGEKFITKETERVQAILAASGGLDDAARKEIFESLMQRLQMLSNLRRVIEVSGSGSNIGVMAEAASTDQQRLSLIASLFGPGVSSHWAPDSPAGVVIAAEPEVASDPVAVLRDTTGRFGEEARKTALYLVLAKNQSLTSSEELWLAEIIDGYLE